MWLSDHPVVPNAIMSLLGRATMHLASKDEAATLAKLLRRHKEVIVFAESCTAGLVAATLGMIPGISTCLAGSAVVYQVMTKAQWLGISQTVLERSGPVSQTVSEQMALAVMKQTPQATIAGSVTGHLGPNAPEDQDGVAWSSIARQTSAGVSVTSRLLHLDDTLSCKTAESISVMDVRYVRQICAVQQVLQFCVEQFPE